MGENPNVIHVPGSQRSYSRNKLLVVLLVPLMMSLMQVSSINTALTTIQQSLAASDAEIQWMISGYALTIGIILVPSGRLGDIFGRSGGFVTGLVIFAIASLLIGFSNDPIQLNLLRVLQGIGSGILSPQTTGLIQQYFQGHDRARAFSYFGLVVSASVAAGPVLSGGLIQLLGPEIGWRSSFILNFPIGLIGVILAFFWLPFGKERRTIGTHKDEIEAEYEAAEIAKGHHPVKRTAATKIDLDPFGMLLLSVAVLGIMLPFMMPGNPWIYTLVIAGAVLMVVWVIWEKHYKARGGFPMVDLSLFSITTFKYGIAIISVFFLGMTSIWAVFLIFLQNAMGATPFELGLFSVPNSVLAAFASLWAGKYAVEHGRAIQFWSLVLYLVGLLGMIGLTFLAAQGMNYWWYLLPTLLLGIGGGAMGAANQTQAMLDVPASSGGTAGGVLQTGQRMATAIGIALVTAVFFNARGVMAPDGSGAHWFFGIAIALSVISAIIFVDLLITFVFWRKGVREKAQ
ncbi:MAG: MFS transporter [Arcanobacterium sp.]|nr:MFS transporter [Arcanobacterium sp.]MDY5589700.1 MFS transporter [Arcanobacterium sp.]